MSSLQPQALGPDLVALLREGENQTAQPRPPDGPGRERVSLPLDRHNIPVTGTVKGPSCDAPSSSTTPQDLPPPYPGLNTSDPSLQALTHSSPQLPQDLGLPPAYHATPSGEAPPILADAPATLSDDSSSLDPAGDNDPQQIPDLEDDPLYHDIQAQVEGAAPIGSCLAFFCITTNRLSYKLHELCYSPVISKRKGTPGDSPNLHRAFVCGWRMLVRVVFPLVPSHAFRCLWTLMQFVLFAIVLGVSIYIGHHDSHTSSSRGQLISASVAVCAAFIDLVASLCVYLRTRLSAPRDPEAEPLLAGLGPDHHRHGRFFSWFSKYSDLVRLVITELVAYVILIYSFPSADFLFGDFTFSENYCYPVGTSKLSTSGVSLLAVSTITFFVCVYLVQFMILLRLLIQVQRQQCPRSPTKRKAFLLFFQLLLFMIGQRIIQVTVLYTVYTASPSQFYGSTGIVTVFGLAVTAYLLPVGSLLVFVACDYGWVEDLCTAYCGDYLGRLKHISSTPRASLAVKHEIEGILQYFEYRKLRKDLTLLAHGYCVRDFLYPIQSPLMLVYCIPYCFFCVYFYVSIFLTPLSDCTDHDFSFAFIISLDYISPVLFFFINFHLIFMSFFYLLSSLTLCPCICILFISNLYSHLHRQ